MAALSLYPRVFNPHSTQPQVENLSWFGFEEIPSAAELVVVGQRQDECYARNGVAASSYVDGVGNGGVLFPIGASLKHPGSHLGESLDPSLGGAHVDQVVGRAPQELGDGAALENSNAAATAVGKISVFPAQRVLDGLPSSGRFTRSTAGSIN